MTASSNLFLVGPMGSGKTAVGKTLARRLRMPFVDTDTEIERRTGVDIPRIFDTEGEVGFRQREREIVAELTATNGVVLSTGGGAVLAAESRAYLRERGTVIYLETSIAQQVARVRGENRPLLSGVADMTARVTELMNQRAPLYAGVAHLTVRTDGRRVTAVVDEILRSLGEREGPGRILPA
jgi:shikimate kinase